MTARGTAAQRSLPAVAVRPVRAADMLQVLAIEARSYPTPWSRQMFASEMARTCGAALVAVQDDERVLGYVMCAGQADCWHVLNVTVHPRRRGRGVGELLLRELFRRTEGRPHEAYTLEVRVSNTRAIGLYRRLGFRDRGVRPRYYTDNGEDALIMWREPGGEA